MSKAVMTKSDAIRAALEGKPLTGDELHTKVEKLIGGIINHKKMMDLVCALHGNGEIGYQGKGETRKYSLDAPPPKANGKRPAVKREHSVATYHELAQKHAPATATGRFRMLIIEGEGSDLGPAIAAFQAALQRTAP